MMKHVLSSQVEIASWPCSHSRRCILLIIIEIVDILARDLEWERSEA